MDSSSIDPKNGYCSKTKTYHNLRPPVPLPPETLPLSAADYVLSLLSSTAASADLGAATFLVDAAAEISLPYSEFLRRVASLKSQLLPKLSKGKVALVLSPASIHVPVLYFALLSLGVVVSPANPLASEYELAHMIRLAQPSIAFAVTSLSGKLPNASLPFGIVCLDSPAFDSMLAGPIGNPSALNSVSVRQSDSAAILYSSGTTGKIKGVELTHRNLIALISGFHHTRSPDEEMTHPVSLFTIPLFHVFGFFMLLRSVAMAETLVLMQRFDFEGMLSAVEKYRITYMPVSPPVVLGFAKSELTNKYDLSSLELLGCGGAPLGKEVAERFRTKFPNVEIVQGYGLTETGGGGARPMDPDESKRYGSVGRLAELLEAKIVDPTTGEALPPGQRGELWLRGPTIMKGYVGDTESTSKTLDPDGWLKTGDVCYFDAEGFLYVVDRLKELIKYKAYQVPPAELEQLLLSHPDIADAAVIPYPDEEAGQIPMAFVVRKPGSSVTGAQIMDFIARKVAPYKKIRRVSFINSIPKSAAGKILRRVLIDQAVSNGLARL